MKLVSFIPKGLRMFCCKYLSRFMHLANGLRRSSPRFSGSDDGIRSDLWFPVEPTCGNGIPVAESALRLAPRGLQHRPALTCGVFFMRLLSCRIGSRQNWPGLAEPELELPEQTLALTDPQLDAVALLNPG